VSSSKIEPRAYLTVASQFASIELVQAVVDDLLAGEALAEESRHWIGLALREAMANAIKHGNGVGDKHVEVEVGFELDDVVLCVRDEGGGFNPETVKDPLAPENLLSTCGRGIFYMRRLMDQVDFRFVENGTEVVLRKRIAAEPAAVDESAAQ
jgi:serine/threonine-protein kinase RsbW